MNIFERAARNKTRFPSGKGNLSVEDLFDLPLNSLNTIAKAVNKKLKEEGEEDFIAVKSKEETETRLQLEILKHVIVAKLIAQAASEKRAETNAKVAQIKELIANKKNEALANKSVDELAAELAELQKS